ncbi:ribose-5-phosphate isomerase A [Clostridium sp. LQ25]|uniref:ribose-5-phosphate isomerase A n=1 Tax=Clostridium TaxID=1485 RepID=UPI001BAB8EBB|nr:ribose-5-phosphate isomerase A [Clostridium sp. LQ25]QUF85179.1 ribose-5-phosphate isomerase A [Clostridium butyricum]UZT08574.1 ribose-5-phosphate isomerase A [Clostridium sp. LQ25]
MIKYNFLVKFNSEDVDDISVLNDKLKKIVGIVDTSLFYNIATKAIVAEENGVRIMECER